MLKHSFLYRLVLLLVPVFIFISAPAHGSGNAELDNAKKLFNNGEINKAVPILEKLIATSTLSPADRVEAWEYLAFCHVARQQNARVQDCFAKIIQIQSDYRPPESLHSHPGLMRAFYGASKESGNGMLPPITAPGGIKTVAVLDFDNNSIDDVERLANLGKGLADILITDLAALSKLKVVERERIQFVMSEIAISDSTVKGRRLVDPQFAVQLGKLMGAQSVLIGSFMKIGKKLRVDARLVKTETSEVLTTESVDGGQDEIFDLAKKLVLKVGQNYVKIEKIDQQKLERLQPQAVPLEANMIYAEALDKLDQERYAEARQLLEKALALAPDFEMAQQKLKVLKTFSKA